MNSHVKYKDKDTNGAYRNVEVGGKTYTRENFNNIIQSLDPNKNKLKEKFENRIKKIEGIKKKQRVYSPDGSYYRIGNGPKMISKK